MSKKKHVSLYYLKECVILKIVVKKTINDKSPISYNKRITYMSKIIQSAVTKLINNEITKLRIARSILLQV